MHAVVKRPEVPCESHGPLLTLPPCPLPRGTADKRKWARSFLAGAGASFRRKARAARAVPPAGSAAGRRHRRLWEGVPGTLAPEPGSAPRPPSQPALLRCRPHGSCLSHSTSSPHPRLGQAGPPQPRAASALPCRRSRSITNSHAARVPRRHTHPAARQSDSRLWGAATIHALLSPLKHPRRPSGCRISHCCTMLLCFNRKHCSFLYSFAVFTRKTESQKCGLSEA
ncbi:uncharacterized protein [Agelaius tricolor]|uniref:uncharacterized protein n=1 Tax=Agelaius tricolor TaxID=9191 RepID=UPI0039F1B566